MYVLKNSMWWVLCKKVWKLNAALRISRSFSSIKGVFVSASAARLSQKRGIHPPNARRPTRVAEPRIAQKAAVWTCGRQKARSGVGDAFCLYASRLRWPLSQTGPYSNAYSKIYIYHYLVTIDFILHPTSIYIRYIYLVELFVCELVVLSLPSYINTWWHIVGSIFI